MIKPWLPRLPAAALLALLLPPAAAQARLAPADRAMLDYVEGRLAQASQDYGEAATSFADALKLHEDAIARRRAFDVAMISGDRKAVARLAQQISLADQSAPATAVGDSIIALTRAGLAASARDWRGYDAATQAFSAPGRGGESGQMLATLLEAWGRAGRGDIDAALQLLDPAAASGVARSYLQEHRAHILAFGKRWSQAAEAYGQMLAEGGSNVSRLRLSAASTMLQAAPDDPETREEVLLLLAGGLERDPQLQAARARMAANPRMTGTQLGYLVASPAEGLGLMFVRLAADLSRERATGAAINFARIATFTAPDLPDGWLVAADVLSMAERYDLALQALQSVPKSDAWRELVGIRRVATLIAAGRDEDARKLLQQAVQRDGASASDWSRLAELERREKRAEQAIHAYDRALALLDDSDSRTRAQLLFLRGSTREQAGDWPEAEKDLRAAIDLQAENPVYLNYLGYSMLVHGGNLAEARDLIARAYEAMPESGAITDSMGWVEYLLGNHEAAVQLLEEAQSAEPADPTVADHLGDVYWTIGRRIEARYAWRSAAALSPEPELAAALTQKLDFGLDAATRP